MGEEEKKKTKLSDFDLVGDESPHIHEPWSSQWKMLQVIIALCIPLAAGTLIFGWQALIHTALGVLVAVATEYLYERFVRHRFTIDDLSAVVTGMLVGMSMPNGASYWATALVALFAIGVVKMFAGGLGSNRFNPAVAGRVIYLLFPWFVRLYYRIWSRFCFNSQLRSFHHSGRSTDHRCCFCFYPPLLSFMGEYECARRSSGTLGIILREPRRLGRRAG